MSLERRPLPPPPNPSEWKPSKPLVQEDDEVTQPKIKAEDLLPIPNGGKVVKKEAPIHEQFQYRETVPAFEVSGFDRLDVVVTMEKKDDNKAFDDEPNQDYFLADPKTGLIGALDGLGHEGYGERASAAAAEAFPVAYKDALEAGRSKSHLDILRAFVENQLVRFKDTPSELLTEKRVELTHMAEQILHQDPSLLRKTEALAQAFVEANEAAKRSGGKTTACIGFVHTTPDGSRWAVVGNTGDSGAFKRRANGEVVPLTKEDSVLNVLRDTGRITDALLAQMKAEPEKKFPVKGIPQPISYNRLRSAMVRSLGSDDFTPAITVRKLEVGEDLMLVSDGVIDVFEDEETLETDLADLGKNLSVGKTLEEQSDHLREVVRERSDIKDDDVVIVLARAIE